MGQKKRPRYFEDLGRAATEEFSAIASGRPPVATPPTLSRSHVKRCRPLISGQSKSGAGEDPEAKTERRTGFRGWAGRSPGFRRSSSGSLAMLAAMRRASSRVSSLAAARRPAPPRVDVGSACPLASRTMKQASVSSADQGGGKRRAEGIKRLPSERRPSGEWTTGHARGGAGRSTGACRSRAAALLLDLARLRHFSGSPFW